MVDKDFFNKYQRIIVWVFNTRLGRRFFAINGYKSSVGDNKIVAVLPNAICWKRNNGKHTTEFRTNNRFAYRMAYALKWMPFFQWNKEFNWTPQLAFGLTVSTFFPDAGTGNTTVDGMVGRETGGETFSTIRDGAGTISPETAISMIAELAAGGVTDDYNNMRKVIMTYDTAAIDDGDDISDVVLSVFGQGGTGTALGSDALHIAASTPASDNALVDADYQQVQRTTFGNVVHASYSNGAYNDITLNASGIANVNKTGISKFSGQLGWDINDNFTGVWFLNGITAFDMSSADATGTSQDPKLVVTHSAPITFTPKVTMF